MIDFDLYQQWTKKTARYPSEIYAVLGLAEEAGEVAGKYAKSIRDGWTEDALHAALLAELGDVLWMVARVADDHHISLSSVVNYNIEKLEGRLVKGTIHGSGDNR